MNKIIIAVIIFFAAGAISAQNSEELYSLYQKKEYIRLKEKYEQVKANLSHAEKLFFESLFTDDAEIAFEKYKELFEKSEGRIKYLAADRLKDYYYAKGYYSTASDYERYLVENRELIESSESAVLTDIDDEPVQDIEKLYIQVGAFGLEDNALQMQQMLETQKVESKIIKREVNSRLLYCVWVIGKENFEQTLNFANDLKQKYHLDYKIIKE